MKNYTVSGVFFLVSVVAFIYFYSRSGEETAPGKELMTEAEYVEQYETDVEEAVEPESCENCVAEANEAAETSAEDVNPWVERCKTDVPEGFGFFCGHIKGPKPYGCLEYMLRNNLSLTQSEFSACGRFSEELEVLCLEELRPGRLDGCLGVNNEFQLECLKIGGFQYRRVCSKIDNSHATTCVRVLYDRDWEDLLGDKYNACALTSESSQVQCFRQAASEEEAKPCFPLKRVSSLVKCFYYQEAVLIEVRPDKKVSLSVDNGVFIASGQLLVKIDPSIEELKEPVELISSPAIFGQFDRIQGLRNFSVEYRDSRLLLVNSKSGVSTIQDLRDERFRGPLDPELYRQKCSK